MVSCSSSSLQRKWSKAPNHLYPRCSVPLFWRWEDVAAKGAQSCYSHLSLSVFLIGTFRTTTSVSLPYMSRLYCFNSSHVSSPGCLKLFIVFSAHPGAHGTATRQYWRYEAASWPLKVCNFGKSFSSFTFSHFRFLNPLTIFHFLNSLH